MSTPEHHAIFLMPYDEIDCELFYQKSFKSCLSLSQEMKRDWNEFFLLIQNKSDVDELTSYTLLYYSSETNSINMMLCMAVLGVWVSLRVV